MRWSPRVLLAEDDADLRHVLSAVMGQAGYEVVEAGSGTELLRSLSAAMLRSGSSLPFDVIVVDYQMPGFSGLELLAGLRDAQWEATMILMSAFMSPEMRGQAWALGADAIFEKPFEFDELLAVVARVEAAGHQRSPESLARHRG